MSWAFSANPHDAGDLGGFLVLPERLFSHVHRLLTPHMPPRCGGQPSTPGVDKHLSFATSQLEGQLQGTHGVSLSGSQSSGGRRG